MEQYDKSKTYSFEELLSVQGYILYTNTGTSMMPLLRPQKDVIEIRKKKERIKKYDVALYRRNGQYILHRCISVDSERYVFAGDHNTIKEYDVTDDMILGVMTRVIRSGKSIYPTSLLYRLYSYLWVNLFPIKAFILKSKSFISRIKRITPVKLKNYLNWKLVNAIDLLNDYRITGQSLSKIVPINSVMTVYETPREPMKYLILKRVFSHVHISSADSFIDVGCGTGRVLAFLISKHCPCQLHGIESDETIGRVADKWTKRYKNVRVSILDIFNIDYNQYTILFLNQSFSSKSFRTFIEHLEKQLNHPMTLICVFDCASSNYLENRNGWSLLYQDCFFQLYGLQVVGSIKSFSIWEYKPPFV